MSQNSISVFDYAKKIMNDSITGDLTNSLKSEKMEELSSWYDKAKKADSSFVSKITNDLVSNFMENFPQKYVQLAIENIQINYADKSPNVKFDTTFELDTIKPYIEFIIKVSGQHVKSSRAKFEVNSNGGFKDIEIHVTKGKKSISLGVLEANLNISLVALPFVDLAEPKELFNHDIVIDLSKYTI